MLEENNNTFQSEDFKHLTPRPNIEQQSSITISEMKQYSEYVIDFLTQSNCAVGLVDMVDSTKISAHIGPKKTARYYQIFLNSMSKIIYRCNGIIIKNIGDSLLYYFPYSDTDKISLTNCIECGLEMIRSKKYLSQQLISEGLPAVDFRISADYGTVFFMKTSINDSIDLIGTPVNMSSKINRLSAKNQFVIGSDLFQMVKELKFCQFKETNHYSLGFKQSYPVYLISDKYVP
jgi:class 3 adenylate cyclase